MTTRNTGNYEVVIKAWIQYHTDTRASKDKDDLFQACDDVTDLVSMDPEQAWPIILELIKQAPTDYVLANVAAGPLEDLICWHREQFIDRIEIQARRDPKFRQCLAGVWCQGATSLEIQERIGKYTQAHRDPTKKSPKRKSL